MSKNQMNYKNFNSQIIAYNKLYKVESFVTK